MSPDEAFVELPPATLLLGAGAWEAGQALFERHRSSFSTKVEKLDAASARHVCEQAYIRPFGRSLRAFLICLDGASAAAQNILLKVLEEPPDTVRFILAAALPPLETIVSRCQVLVEGDSGPAAPDPGEDQARQVVATALRAARDHHLAVVDTVMRNWEPGHTALLRAWAAERAADRWAEFSVVFVDGTTIRQALTILAVLRAYEGARSAAAVALDKAFRG